MAEVRLREWRTDDEGQITARLGADQREPVRAERDRTGEPRRLVVFVLRVPSA